MMADGSVERSFSASADEAWAAVGDFGGIDQLFPDLESFRLEGDDRILGMFGMEIRERLISRDDAAKHLVYSIVEGVPLESHEGRITVTAEGSGSKVTWAFTVTPDEMAPIMEGTYTGALDALEKHFSA
ncbi:MAG: SRPBCC family protein [Actinobacteria bacterium]|nr:SRPBCC family protein [Actinomycetota bacterium]